MGMKAKKILRVNCTCESEKMKPSSSSSIGQCCCFSEDVALDTDEDDDSDKESGPYLRKSVSKEGIIFFLIYYLRGMENEQPKPYEKLP